MRIRSLHNHWQNIWDGESQVVAVEEELLDDKRSQLPVLVHLVRQPLEQWLLNHWDQLLVDIAGSLALGEHKDLVEPNEGKLALLGILHVVKVVQLAVQELVQVLS